MKDTPILMCAEMVRATLRGPEPKTQTRRVCRHQYWSHSELHDVNKEGILRKIDRNVTSPYGAPGDRLWVRETYRLQRDCPTFYRATTPMEDSAWIWKPSIFMPRKLSRIDLEVVNVRVERVQESSEADAIAEGLQKAWCDDQGETPGRYLYFSEADSKGAGHSKPSEAYRVLWNSINLAPRLRQGASAESTGRYESFPWSHEDFDARFPGVRAKGVFRGKPITVVANPWVWVVEFRRKDEGRRRKDEEVSAARAGSEVVPPAPDPSSSSFILHPSSFRKGGR